LAFIPSQTDGHTEVIDDESEPGEAFDHLDYAEGLERELGRRGAAHFDPPDERY
jgi:hypothetical protein